MSSAYRFDGSDDSESGRLLPALPRARGASAALFVRSTATRLPRRCAASGSVTLSGHAECGLLRMWLTPARRRPTLDVAIWSAQTWQKGGTDMLRSIDFHPSSTPPVSARDLVRYADRWVVVRAGKVVHQAASYDELIARCTSGRSTTGDRFLHLPPQASRANPTKPGPTRRSIEGLSTGGSGGALAVPIDEGEDRPPFESLRAR